MHYLRYVGLWLVLLCSYASPVYSQGFSIESENTDENWGSVLEDKYGNIVLSGWIEGRRNPSFVAPGISVYDAGGTIRRRKLFSTLGITGFSSMVETDSGYVVFCYVSQSTSNTSSLHTLQVSYDLTQYRLRPFGDTSRNTSLVKVKKALNNQDWIVVLSSQRRSGVSYQKLILQRFDRNFTQILKQQDVVNAADSSKQMLCYDFLEIPNNKGYVALLNGELVNSLSGGLSGYSNYYSLLYLDSNFQGNFTPVLSEAFPGQSSPGRSGIRKVFGRGGIAMESDSVLVFYGTANYYPFNPGLLNFCVSDTCTRSVKSRWKVPSMSFINTAVNPPCGCISFYERAGSQGTRHLVWGSMDRDDFYQSSYTSNTRIFLEEYQGSQLLSSRILDRNGYWFQPYNIIKARNGDYLLLARYNKFIDSAVVHIKPLLARIDSSGPFLVSTSVVSKKTADVWPNPVVGGKLNVQLEEGIGTAQIWLMDLQGRALLKDTFYSPRYSLSVEGLPSGLYLIQIRDFKGLISVHKILIP